MAATLVPASLIWDFSWESSIGADRFWSPPHLAMHIGVWLSGVLAVWLTFTFTFARHRSHSLAGINLGPLCAPAGAWILLWSTATLEVAFLFDIWWQRTYGLAAGLWHPPQILKATGFFGILFATLLFSSEARGMPTLGERWVTVARSWPGGLVVTLCALVLTMTNYPNLQHTSSFCLISCAIYPLALLAAGTAGPGRWGATGVALAYTIQVCAMVWFLPLFPARPLTPPIYNHVEHLMPPAFPLLLVVPAFFMDAARAIVSALCSRGPLSERPVQQPGRELWQSAASAAVFVATCLPVQWFFAKFLLSPQADNWFFAGGGHYWPYFLRIDRARTMFWGTKADPFGWTTLVWSLLFATFSAWLGLRVGNWLARMRR